MKWEFYRHMKGTMSLFSITNGFAKMGIKSIHVSSAYQVVAVQVCGSHASSEAKTSGSWRGDKHDNRLKSTQSFHLVLHLTSPTNAPYHKPTSKVQRKEDMRTEMCHMQRNTDISHILHTYYTKECTGQWCDFWLGQHRNDLIPSSSTHQ